MSTLSRRLFGAIALAAAVPVRVEAAPKLGEELPDARVEDADGKRLALRSLVGDTLVIVYEDKDSSSLNDAFKKDLAKLPADSFTAVPIADVSEYNSWPAKGFVKDAIRDESKKAGITIWCDWDASCRKALALPKGTSSVVVVGKRGKLLYAFDGELSASERKAAISAITGDS